MTESVTLEERAEQLAAEVPTADRSEAAGAVTWSVGARPVAILAAGVIELRLDPAVARAATRTPDTTPSPRGQEWVRFAPPTLDGPADDRLEAWFRFARRRAGEARQTA
ncbi:MAG TPA: hypothetical protein VFP19_01605 [Candidatus Limnocylindrales bacterium]|nr:hypothetical protein [Candidatus Limnocylindrales bacterium]